MLSATRSSRFGCGERWLGIRHTECSTVFADKVFAVRSQSDEEELSDILKDVDMVNRFIVARVKKGDSLYVVDGANRWSRSAQTRLNGL